MRRINSRRRQNKKLKSQKGAITILVLVSVLFMVSFLITTQIIGANKVKNQKEIINRTREIYESNKSMEEIYDSFTSDSGVIPIYTSAQLSNIGSGNTVFVRQNGKYYNFANDAIYILMDDLGYDENNISKTFEGYLEGNGHTITITNEYDEGCLASEENNFHGLLLNVPNEYSEDLASISNIIDGVIIPTGFKYVKGTKDTGIVITDSFSGEEDEGNEFVWVPVDGTTITFTKTAFKNASLGTTEASFKYWCDETTQEFQDLSASVAKYKGFYFGRYETSKVPDDPNNVPQIKRGYAPWTNIKESAFTKSSNMYDGVSNYLDYISTHLVYPHEWDTTLNWIISTGTKTYAEINSDSSSWGNYKPSALSSGSIQNTGFSDEWCTNNIYDIAGNVGEISQEFYGNSSNSITNYSFRGGSYSDLGSNDPAGDRVLGSDAKAYYGYRICMMINP